MARSAYLVCYDIADDRRRTSVYEVCRGYGERVQYRVFRCHIDRSELLVMQAALRTKIHHDEDQILFVDLGPVEGRGRRCVSALGRRYEPPDDGPRDPMRQLASGP